MKTVDYATENVKTRDLKRFLQELLDSDAWRLNLSKLEAFPPKRVINPLFSLLPLRDELKLRAVAAIGSTVKRMADTDLESVRVIMRRFMWSLNDESGGIGWGAPEAMAEVMIMVPRMSEEFGSVYMSYMNPNGNYIEFPALQKGLLWGILRLIRHSSMNFESSGQYLSGYLQETDPSLLVYSAMIIADLYLEQHLSDLEKFRTDQRTAKIFLDYEPSHMKVCDAVNAAIEQLRLKTSLI